ncbi:unnamed protein product, partial [Pylaiella littoralis]
HPPQAKVLPFVVVTSATMGRHLYTAGARALALVLTPLSCHAFVSSATANSIIVKGGQIRNHVTRMMSSSEFGGIQHAGVLVSDTKASKEFYVKVLGFEDESTLRPHDKLPFDGAFVRAGATQIHLMELPNPDPIDGRPEHGGRDRHVAFTIADLQPLKGRLDGAGVTYTMSKSGRAALFCRDLDGNAFEVSEAASI